MKRGIVKMGHIGYSSYALARSEWLEQNRDCHTRTGDEFPNLLLVAASPPELEAEAIELLSSGVLYRDGVDELKTPISNVFEQSSRVVVDLDLEDWQWCVGYTDRKVPAAIANPSVMELTSVLERHTWTGVGPSMGASMEPTYTGWAVCFFRNTHDSKHDIISTGVTRGEEPITVDKLESAIKEAKRIAAYMWLDYPEYYAVGITGKIDKGKLAIGQKYVDDLREKCGSTHTAADLRAAYEARQKGERV